MALSIATTTAKLSCLNTDGKSVDWVQTYVFPGKINKPEAEERLKSGDFPNNHYVYTDNSYTSTSYEVHDYPINMEGSWLYRTIHQINELISAHLIHIIRIHLTFCTSVHLLLIFSTQKFKIQTQKTSTKKIQKYPKLSFSNIHTKDFKISKN